MYTIHYVVNFVVYYGILATIEERCTPSSEYSSYCTHKTVA